MNKVHEIFPLVIYQDSIECHEEFKKENIISLKKYWFNGYENESPEYSGKIFLHLDPQYNLFFSDLKKSIDNYFYHLNVDYSKLDYHVTKSWVGYHNKKIPGLNLHNHNESNISFVYYLKSSDTSDKFCVSQSRNVNENTGGLFETSKQRNTIKGFNKYNCNNYTITPYEGSVLIFPSSTLHSTLKISEKEDERIVIAGDVRVTLKEEHYNHHQGSIHPNQWKQI